MTRLAALLARLAAALRPPPRTCPRCPHRRTDPPRSAP